MTTAFTLHANDGTRSRVLSNCQGFLDRLPESKSWRIEIAAYRKPRTIDANAYLWAACYPPLVEATGYSLDEIHEFFCGEYFGTVERDVFGTLHVKPRRTTTTNERGERDVLGKREFGDFIERIQAKAAELGVYVPAPEEREAA